MLWVPFLDKIETKVGIQGFFHLCYSSFLYLNLKDNRTQIHDLQNFKNNVISEMAPFKACQISY